MDDFEIFREQKGFPNEAVQMFHNTTFCEKAQKLRNW